MIGPRITQVFAPGVADGTYGVVVVDGKIVSLTSVLDALPDFLVTVTDGIPSLVFDGDGHVVYTEVP